MKEVKKVFWPAFGSASICKLVKNAKKSSKFYWNFLPVIIVVNVVVVATAVVVVVAVVVHVVKLQALDAGRQARVFSSFFEIRLLRARENVGTEVVSISFTTSSCNGSFWIRLIISGGAVEAHPPPLPSSTVFWCSTFYCMYNTGKDFAAHV